MDESMGVAPEPDKRRSAAMRRFLTGCAPASSFHAMRVADRIREKLTAGLQPNRLAIVDESHRHAGHAGARPEGESHFRVEVVAAAFVGESRIARQRRVYALLAEELAGPVHALALTTLTPEEDKKN
jgi:BolA family transcriptional regulator, general stress-responsive regulator